MGDGYMYTIKLLNATMIVLKVEEKEEVVAEDDKNDSQLVGGSRGENI